MFESIKELRGASIKNNVTVKNVILLILLKFLALYLPHAFKILKQDFNIEH
jgi:hypothetical protein